MIFRKPIVQRRRHHQALIDLIIDKTFCHVLFFSDPAAVSGPLHNPTRSVFINYLSCPSSTPLQLSPLLPPITESIPDRLLVWSLQRIGRRPALQKLRSATSKCGSIPTLQRSGTPSKTGAWPTARVAQKPYRHYPGFD